MKDLWIKASIVAALVMFAGCADSSDEDTNLGGCEPTCRDAQTLVTCENGVAKSQFCANGCVNGACAQTAVTQCTKSTCKDANTLNYCVGGIQTEVTCPFGCANDMCNSTAAKCTGNVCKDAETLLVCAGSVQKEMKCPHGCENGACKYAPVDSTVAECTQNECKDASVLVACNNGQKVEVTCPHGCANGACQSETPVGCTAGDKQCSGNTIQYCVNGSWIDVTPCPNSCSNGMCVDAPAATCTDGAKKCDGSSIMYCISNNWVNVTTCPGGCENGNCVASQPAAVCSANQTSCQGNQQLVCVNGQWAVGEACSYGCSNGACLACSNGQSRCASGYMQVCSNNAWVNSQACAQGCNASGTACNETQVTCVDGQKQCNGAMIQTCSNNTWVNGNVCDNGCENGACKGSQGTTTDPVPQTGACDPETYVESCANNTVYYCDENEVVTLDCTSGSRTCMVDNTGYADCATACSASQKGQVTGYACQSLMGMYFAIPLVCSETQSGAYGGFAGESYEICDAYCSPTEGCTNKLEYSICSAEGVAYCQTNGYDTCLAENTMDSTCADVCQKEGEITTKCQEVEGYGYAVHYQCSKVGNQLVGIMADYDECQAGCNASKTDCAGSGGSTQACTNGALKCSNSGVPQKCVNGAWVDQAACGTGNVCSNGVCVSSGSTTTPVVGSACDSNTFEYVCTGETLYYCYNNSVVTLECSSKNEMMCDVLKDGSQDCVYTGMDGYCTDGEHIPAFNDPCMSGYYYHIRCEKDKAGQLVGIEDIAYSVCEGNTMYGCSGNTETSKSCSSCSYDASSYSAICR